MPTNLPDLTPPEQNSTLKNRLRRHENLRTSKILKESRVKGNSFTERPEHFRNLVGPSSTHRKTARFFCFGWRGKWITKAFTFVYSAYKKALQCFGEFISRCKPDRPEARTFIDQMSALLNQCDSPQVRQDVLVILECGRRMGSVHERCIRETRFIPQLKTLSSERLLQGETNSLRDLCWWVCHLLLQRRYLRKWTILRASAWNSAGQSQ